MVNKRTTLAILIRLCPHIKVQPNENEILVQPLRGLVMVIYYYLLWFR